MAARQSAVNTSLQPEDHRTLHDEIDGGGNLLGR